MASCLLFLFAACKLMSQGDAQSLYLLGGQLLTRMPESSELYRDMSSPLFGHDQGFCILSNDGRFAFEWESQWRWYLLPAGARSKISLPGVASERNEICFYLLGDSRPRLLLGDRAQVLRWEPIANKDLAFTSQQSRDRLVSAVWSARSPQRLLAIQRIWGVVKEKLKGAVIKKLKGYAMVGIVEPIEGGENPNFKWLVPFDPERELLEPMAGAFVSDSEAVVVFGRSRISRSGSSARNLGFDHVYLLFKKGRSKPRELRVERDLQVSGAYSAVEALTGSSVRWEIPGEKEWRRVNFHTRSNSSPRSFESDFKIDRCFVFRGQPFWQGGLLGNAVPVLSWYSNARKEVLTLRGARLRGWSTNGRFLLVELTSERALYLLQFPPLEEALTPALTARNP